MNQVRVVALFALLVTALPAVRAKAAAAQHEGHLATGSPALIDAVRQATEPFRDVHRAAPVDSPNRFGLPAHYELHVWAWRENPNGTFVDWNPLVSCEAQ